MKSLLVILLGATLACAAAPRAYVSLASVSGSVGYHGWTMHNRGVEAAWLDGGVQAIEGTWFLNHRVGLGFRFFDGALAPVFSDSTGGAYAVMYGFAMPSVSWVLNPRAKRFSYLQLALMPYMWDNSGNVPIVSSAFALDCGYVPYAPWPLEGRVRLATTVFNWSSHETAWQLSAGIRAGVSWWFMR